MSEIHISNLINQSMLLQPHSPAFARLKHQLKLSLRLVNSGFQDLKIYQVSSSAKELSSDKTTTIETIEMVKTDVIKHKYPRRVACGSIIESVDELSQDSNDFTFCVYRVKIGKSYCHKLENGELIDKVGRKAGFDSIYLENYNSGKSIFQMNYLIHDPELVELSHVIKCKLIVNEQSDLAAERCKMCGEVAQYYCSNDNAYFCAQCDASVHEELHQDANISQRESMLR